MGWTAPKAMKFYNSPFPHQSRESRYRLRVGISGIVPVLKKLPKRGSIISPALVPSILQTS
jgi:hypothetical protein